MQILKDMKEITLRSEIPLLLKKYNLNNIIAEIGVRYGYNFRQLLSCNPRMAIGIDHYNITDNPAEQDINKNKDDLNKIYLNTVDSFLSFESVRIIRATSKEAESIFPLFYFDYIYIDADHSYEGCLRDMELWWKHIRQGGIMAGHDYIDAVAKNGVPFGVIQAVKDFRKKYNIVDKYFHSTTEGYCSWLIYKKDGE